MIEIKGVGAGGGGGVWVIWKGHEGTFWSLSVSGQRFHGLKFVRPRSAHVKGGHFIACKLYIKFVKIVAKRNLFCSSSILRHSVPQGASRSGENARVV